MLKVTEHCLSQGKLPLPQGTAPPKTCSAESMDPGLGQSASSFPCLASVGTCVCPCHAQQREARGRGEGQAGPGYWARGTLPPLQSRQAAVSPLPVSSLPNTGSANFSGEKGLGPFLSWKQQGLFQLERDQLAQVTCVHIIMDNM